MVDAVEQAELLGVVLGQLGPAELEDGPETFVAVVDFQVVGEWVLRVAEVEIVVQLELVLEVHPRQLVTTLQHQPIINNLA